MCVCLFLFLFCVCVWGGWGGVGGVGGWIGVGMGGCDVLIYNTMSCSCV